MQVARRGVRRSPAWTLYGGHRRGFAPHIAAEFSGDFPLAEKVGDSFQIGLGR